MFLNNVDIKKFRAARPDPRSVWWCPSSWVALDIPTIQLRCTIASMALSRVHKADPTGTPWKVCLSSIGEDILR